MTKNEENKKRLYINLALLFVIFCIFAFFFFPKIFSGSENDTVVSEKSSESTFVRKYSNIKSIETNIFADERFKALKNPVTENNLEPRVGNLEPFKPR